MKTVTIDGHIYEIGMLPAEKSLDVLERLARLLGPGLKGIIEHGGDEKLLAGQALMALLTCSQPGSLTPLVKDLLSSTTLQGSLGAGPVSAVFTTHFTGRTLSALRLAIEAAKVNYADFFAALGALGQAVDGGSRA